MAELLEEISMGDADVFGILSHRDLSRNRLCAPRSSHFLLVAKSTIYVSRLTDATLAIC
jgi:hypothetical protein